MGRPDALRLSRSAMYSSFSSRRKLIRLQASARRSVAAASTIFRVPNLKYIHSPSCRVPHRRGIHPEGTVRQYDIQGRRPSPQGDSLEPPHYPALRRGRDALQRRASLCHWGVGLAGQGADGNGGASGLKYRRNGFAWGRLWGSRKAVAGRTLRLRSGQARLPQEGAAACGFGSEVPKHQNCPTLARRRQG